MAKINTTYDVGAAFEAIEEELIASIIRNMRRHKLEEIDEDRQWAMWQTLQLEALEKFKRENRKKYKAQFRDINKQLETLISIAHSEGGMEQEEAILKAIKKGLKVKRTAKGVSAEFFKLNEKKLEALIKATMDDMEKAEYAILRKSEDMYRKVIFNAQVYANTGAGTYEKAVDMATKDFLAAGLTCVEYANGAVHTLADYADMAIRTAAKRAYLQGEGEKRQEWGISTVIMNKRGHPCPKCLPFAGKILIDDVWSGGSRKDGPYPLMSAAIAAGLYHPRCRDVHTTYFPGISTPGKPWTKEEIKELEAEAKREERRQYAERQARKYGRMARHSLDPENREGYKKKKEEWEERKIEKNETYDILNVVEIIHKSVGAKSRNYDVLNPLTGEYVHLAEGTRLVQPKNHVIAGKGRNRQIDCIDWLMETYPGGSQAEWTKEKGFGYVLDEYGEARKVELHWYQNPKIGKVEMKIKTLPGGGLYIDED